MSDAREQWKPDHTREGELEEQLAQTVKDAQEFLTESERYRLELAEAREEIKRLTTPSAVPDCTDYVGWKIIDWSDGQLLEGPSGQRKRVWPETDAIGRVETELLRVVDELAESQQQLAWVRLVARAAITGSLVESEGEWLIREESFYRLSASVGGTFGLPVHTPVLEAALKRALGET